MLFISGSSLLFLFSLVSFVDYTSYGLPLKTYGLVCDPMEHKYYREQFGICSDCDKCFPGDEVKPLVGADLGIGLHGATLCRGCQHCRDGTFNSEENLQWYCSPCTVCADLGMTETDPCTPTRDTICSDTPPPIHPQLNNMKNKSMVLPYKDIDTHDDRRFYVEFIAITSLSLIFLICIALAVYFVWRKQRRVLVRAEKQIRFQPVSKTDVCVCTDSSLHDIQEEHSGDEDTALLPRCDHKVTEKEKDKKHQPPYYNLRKRRQSCQPIVTPTIPTTPIDKNNGAKVQGFRRQRLQSLPVTTTEIDDCKSSFCQRAPSDGFIQFLSILLAGDRAYINFAEAVGLQEYNIKLIETELKDRNIRDISYEVIKRILQIHPTLRVIDIYNTLDKLGFQDQRSKLEEKVEQFKIMT